MLHKEVLHECEHYVVGVGVVANLISNFILLVSSVPSVPFELSTPIASGEKYFQFCARIGESWVGVVGGSLNLQLELICELHM